MEYAKENVRSDIFYTDAESKPYQNEFESSYWKFPFFVFLYLSGSFHPTVSFRLLKVVASTLLISELVGDDFRVHEINSRSSLILSCLREESSCLR